MSVVCASLISCQKSKQGAEERTLNIKLKSRLNISTQDCKQKEAFCFSSLQWPYNQNKYTYCRSKHNKIQINRYTKHWGGKVNKQILILTKCQFFQGLVLDSGCCKYLWVGSKKRMLCIARQCLFLLLCNSPAVASKDLTVNQKCCQHVSTELKGYEKTMWWIKLALNTFWMAAWLRLKHGPMSVVKHVLSTHPHTHLYIWCHPATAERHGWGTGLQGSQECNCKKGEMGWLDRVFSHNLPILQKLLISLPLSPPSSVQLPRGHQC